MSSSDIVSPTTFLRKQLATMFMGDQCTSTKGGGKNKIKRRSKNFAIPAERCTSRKKIYTQVYKRKKEKKKK